jgi:hypothetical protein
VITVLRENAAQGSHQQALARAGHRTLDHNAFSHAAPP